MTYANAQKVYGSSLRLVYVTVYIELKVVWNPAIPLTLDGT